MKTYNLEFTFFDESWWKRIEIEITHTSIIGLMKAFISETRYIYELDSNGKLPEHKKMVKDCWNRNKNNITQEELHFPIIKRQYQ